VVSLGAGVKKRVTLNVQAIQQKNLAARVLYELAAHLKGHMGPFVLPALEVLLNLSAEKHSGDVRASSTLAIVKTVEAYLDGLKRQVSTIISSNPQEVIQQCLLRLLQSLRNEINNSSRSSAAESMRDIISACFEASSVAADGSRFAFLVTPDLISSQQLVKELLQLCGESLSRRSELLGGNGGGARRSRAGADINERFEEEDLSRSATSDQAGVEEEEDVLACLSDAIGCLLKLHGERLMPLFDSLVVGAFSPYLSPRQPPSLQAIAVCLLDDAIEFGGEASHKYIASLLPVLIANTSISVSHAVLRQSSSYGIARAVAVAPHIVCQDIPAVLACLHSIISQSNSHITTTSENKTGGNKEINNDDGEEDDEAEEENCSSGTIENAVFAVGILCTDPRYRSTLDGCRDQLGVNRAELAGLWLRHLPLREDEAEAKAACKQLCDGLEELDGAICGEGFKNLGEILRVLGEVFRFCVEKREKMMKNLKKEMHDGCMQEDVQLDNSDENPCFFAHPHTLRRMIGFLRRVMMTNTQQQQQEVGGFQLNQVEQAVQALSPPLQYALKQALIFCKYK